MKAENWIMVTDKMPEEEWRDVVGYEGLYKVSNLGRVKSLPCFRGNGKAGYYTKERIKSAGKDKDGYLQVDLFLDKKRKMYKIHRLVAKAFIPNPHNLPNINHKDEDKTNNIVSNLEWCTQEYNINYGNANKKRAVSCSFEVEQFTMDGVKVAEYKSGREAAKAVGAQPADISRNITGRKPSCKGFIWRRKVKSMPIVLPKED